jgi:hypothetical protein
MSDIACRFNNVNVIEVIKKKGTKMRNRKAEKTDEIAPDPFNLDALRAPQDFQQTGGVRKTTLNVRASARPPKDKFIRVHPFVQTYGQEDWCLNVVLFNHQYDDEIFAENFIVPAGSDAFKELYQKLKSGLIVCGITAAGSKFLWELTLPTPGNNRRANQWHETRLACAKRAVDSWIRPEADVPAGGYNYVEPLGTLPDPEWGGETFETLVRVAYHDRIISTVEHPVVREFLGG